MIPHSVRRALLTTGAILIFLVLAGATYQGVATALERRQFRHPGQLVDVGGHQLHIYCTGEGSPTVVLEAPATGMSAAWGWVQPEVTKATRVCSYDRAGLGWSEAGDRPYEPALVAEQLRALVERAAERAPYVIVGQGLGAAFARLDAARFGGAAAAVILVDPPAADTDGSPVRPMVRLVSASPWLARAGILRATRMISGSASGLPEPAVGALTAFLNRPDHLTRAARELSRWDETLRLAAGASFQNGPTVVRTDAAGRERIAFLTDARQAARVSAAVIAAVNQVRGR